MERCTLQYKDNISKKQAREKICAHAMYGNHGIRPRPTSIQEVQQYFLGKGINTNTLTELCRNPKEPVPDFENLIRSTWHATSNVSLVDSDGEVIFKMGKDGLFIWSNYESHFEAACTARDRTVTEVSYSPFQECLSQGFAAIEAFLNTEARAWNKKHPKDKLLDSKNYKVSLENKIDEWVPKISNGAKIDKSNQIWNHFKVLKTIRDDNAIHPKLPGQGVSYQDFANQINTFRFGIAQLLGNLHLLLSRPVPSVIINTIYAPDVKVVKILNNVGSK